MNGSNGLGFKHVDSMEKYIDRVKNEIIHEVSVRLGNSCLQFAPLKRHEFANHNVISKDGDSGNCFDVN